MTLPGTSWEERFDPYLQDESRFRGTAERIAFPADEAALRNIVQCYDGQITIQGGKTGIVGGAVPQGGLIINLNQMNRPLSLRQDDDGHFLLTVQAGYPLSTLRADLDNLQFEWLGDAPCDEATWNAFRSSPPLFWPPDPSETSALLGGIAATNAAGPCAWRYGRSANHIHALRVILANGQVWDIARGEYQADDGALPLPDGTCLSIDPTAMGRDETADLIDFFLGSEGTLGVLSSLTLRLSVKPQQLWGIGFFFPDEASAATFVEKTLSAAVDSLAAMDFLDRASIDKAQAMKPTAAKLQELPDVPPDAAAMIYLELHHDDEAAIEEAAGTLMEIAMECGSDVDSSWAVSGDGEMEKIRAFRHAVPESINAHLDALCLDEPSLHKLASDIALPSMSFAKLLHFYRKDLADLPFDVMLFGHAAKKHLHVNFLPIDPQQMAHGKEIIASWARVAVDAGLPVAEENGVGKLKRDLFAALSSPEEKRAHQTLKQRLDPVGIWNPGNGWSLP